MVLGVKHAVKHVVCEWSTSNHGRGAACQLCMQLLGERDKAQVRHSGQALVVGQDQVLCIESEVVHPPVGHRGGCQLRCLHSSQIVGSSNNNEILLLKINISSNNFFMV